LDEFQHPDDTNYWWNDMPEPKHFLMTPNAEHSEATGILEITPAIGTWISYLLREQQVPTFNWEISETTGEIVATLDDQGDVYEASMWWANSCGANHEGVKGLKTVQRRDFRIVSMDQPCLCGIPYEGYCGNLKSLWTREILTAEIVDGKRVYRASRPAPEDGRFTAFLIDIKYKELEPTVYSSAVNTLDVFNRLKQAGNKLIPVDKPGRLEFTTQVSIWPNTFPYDDCHGEHCAGELL
jgi:hypothetical protein